VAVDQPGGVDQGQGDGEPAQFGKAAMHGLFARESGLNAVR
jgi:hypothetical protein